MIINKVGKKLKEISCNIPLSYEYDTNTKSVVLLKGYSYVISYDGVVSNDYVELKEENISE